MTKYFYWNKYDQPFRSIYWLLFAIFCCLVVTVVALQLYGVENLVQWNVLTIDSSYPIDFKVFSVGPFSFSLPAEMRVLTEHFSGGTLPSALAGSQWLLAAIGMALLLYLAIITMFKRLWYLVGMAGALLFLILFNVESLHIFGWGDTKAVIFVFVILLTPSYYLHAFSSNTGFLKRLWVMGIALVLLVVMAFFYSETPLPFMRLFSYGILAPYILIFLFIVTVAHELMATFINVITGSDGIADRTRIRHFLIISLIYLANVLLSYLYAAHYIDWQLIYIDPFLLLAVSAFLGVWGTVARAKLYVGASGLEALWPILYLVIGIVSMGTVVFLMASFNDPMLKVLRDFIIYAHLGIGFAFLLYILYNFIPLIERGFSTQKILYNPTNLPYLTYRLMGILIIVALFAIRGFEYPVWYSLGGYYNLNADLELAKGDLEVAKAYYRNADIYAYHNHKANYNLGMIYAASEQKKALEYYDKADDQWPTAQAIVNKANIETNLSDYYQALFTLREGLKTVPGNDELLNNLALQFEQVRILDSVDYYLAQADKTNAHIQNNRIAFSAKYRRSMGADSIKLFRDLDKAGQANAAALGILQGSSEMKNADHMYDMVYLNNRLLLGIQGYHGDELYEIRHVIDSTKNADYQARLKFNWSLAAYNSGDITSAIEGFSDLSVSSTELSDRAKLTLAKIYMSLGEYEQAIDLMHDVNGMKPSLPLAVANLENGTPEESAEYWQKLAENGDQAATDIVAMVYSEKVRIENEQQRYLFIRYNRFFKDEYEIADQLQKLSNPDLKISLALDLSAYYHRMNNDRAATMMLKVIEGAKMGLEEYKRYVIMTALTNRDPENVQQQLTEFDSLLSFEPAEAITELTLNHLAGMQLDSADYFHMANDNPFMVDAVLIAVEQLRSAEDPFLSYSYLAKAVQHNPGSPRLMEAYILASLEQGFDQFAENGLFEYRQRFSGQSYALLKAKYDKKLKELEEFADPEPN